MNGSRRVIGNAPRDFYPAKAGDCSTALALPAEAQPQGGFRTPGGYGESGAPLDPQAAPLGHPLLELRDGVAIVPEAVDPPAHPPVGGSGLRSPPPRNCVRPRAGY